MTSDVIKAWECFADVAGYRDHVVVTMLVKNTISETVARNVLH